MPDYSSNASTLRAGNWHGQVWAASIPQTVVLGGTLSATPTFSAQTLAYTTTSGSSANVKRDQRVVFYRAGVRIGETRVAFSGTITSTSLPIAETSANTINFTSGDTFTVIEQWNIQDRLVSASSAFNKDSRITIGTYASDPPPVANAGGLWYGFLDSGQTYATVTFDATTSFVVDPDSTVGTYLWAVSDGTITVGTTTTSSITVRFPAGFRHVTLTFTDSGNSVSTIRYVPVYVFDPAGTLPMRVTSLSLNSTTKDGWSGEIEIARESAHDLTTLPDGSLIVLFEQSYYGTTQASYRSAVANRSHILAALFLESETIDFQPGSGAVTFRAEGPLAVLKRTPALPQLMISGSTADWQHLKTLSVNRALWYIAYWHQTSLDYFDFVWLSGSEVTYPRIAVVNIDSIAGQLSDVAQSILADPTCDALGRILLIRNPNYLSTAARSALTTTWAFTTADIVDASMDRLHHGSVKHVRGEGITSGNVPVFSNAGNAPSPIGVSSETLARQIIVNQAELNTRTGKHFAQINGLYNGVFVPQSVRVNVPDGYAIFDPAYREWVTVTLASTTNDRGVAFTTATRWTVDAISISYQENGGRDVELTISAETDGPDGVSYTPPADTGPASNIPGIDTNIPGAGDFYPLPGPITSGTGTVATFWTDNYLRITSQWSAVTPPYTTTDLTALTNWGGGTLVVFIVDAFSPKYLATGSTVNGWICTTTQVQRITDIFGSPALGTAHTLPGAASARRNMQFERGVQNWGIVTSYIYGTGTRASYTTDGSTWTDVTVTNFWDTTSNNSWTPGIYLDPNVAGKAYTTAVTTASTTDASLTTDGFVTTDYGATWTAISNPNITPGNGLAIRIDASVAASGKPVYFNKYVYVGGTAGLNAFLFRADGSGAPVDISPVVSADSYSEFIILSDDDPNTALMWGSNHTSADAAKRRIIAVTHNARAASPSWTIITAPTATLPYYPRYISGVNTFYFVGVGVLAFSTDGGVTILDKTGDIVTSATSVGLCGG